MNNEAPLTEGPIILAHECPESTWEALMMLSVVAHVVSNILETAALTMEIRDESER